MPEIQLEPKEPSLWALLRAWWTTRPRAEEHQVTNPTIRYDADTGVIGAPEPPRGLDEFVAHNATVHFEAMSEAQFWIGVTLADGRSWSINCGAVHPRAKGFAICEED